MQLGPLTQAIPSTRPGTPSAAPPQPLLLIPSTHSPKGFLLRPSIHPSTHPGIFLSSPSTLPSTHPLHSTPPLTHPGISLRSPSTATCSPSVLMSAMKRLAPNCAISRALHKPIPRAEPARRGGRGGDKAREV